MDIQTLASSSGGNCSLITCGDTHILLDAGISMRRITQKMFTRGISPGSLSGIFITHEHTDHIKGLKMIFKYWNAPVFATAGTIDALSFLIPESRNRITEIIPGEDFEVGSVQARAVSTPHDAAMSVGYTFTDGVKKLSYFTDMGKITREIADAAEGSDAVVIEANHDIEMLKSGVYPYYLKARILSDRGHLSNKRCGDFVRWLSENGTKNIVLAHLSRENNRPDVAYETVSEALGERVHSVNLTVAPPDETGELILC